MKRTTLFLIIFLASFLIVRGQDAIVSYQVQEEPKLLISGELLTDERFLLKKNNDWAWNENRLTLKLDKKIEKKSKFHSEVWLRNMGLPNTMQSSDLYNKGIIDPYNIEIREAYVHILGFLNKNLDLKVGRQRITWGTADKLNPTDNLNPYDVEDILDFGRHRSSDAINLNYYFNTDFSLQAVFIPFFQPANLPVGIFANALNPTIKLPQGMTLTGYSDNLLMPKYNIGESTVAGSKFKGMIKGVDFSLSYVFGRDGLPVSKRNTFIPVDTLGGIYINSQLSYERNHIIGADLSTSIAGIGFWAEAAMFIPENDVIMTNNLSAIYPMFHSPVTQDSILVDKPYIKFIVGGDYNFSDGSYFNMQYLHGFIHEIGSKNLSDYFFLQYEKKFFNDKLKVTPVSGAFVVTDWNKIKDNYAIIYKPQISYQATADVEITLSTLLLDGKGDNMFANLIDYNMFMFNLKYSF